MYAKPTSVELRGGPASWVDRGVERPADRAELLAHSGRRCMGRLPRKCKQEERKRRRGCRCWDAFRENANKKKEKEVGVVVVDVVAEICLLLDFKEGHLGPRSNRRAHEV